MKWQLCPKCLGQGIVSKPPYVSGDAKEWASTSCSHVCNMCNGSMKILEAPDWENKAELKR